MQIESNIKEWIDEMCSLLIFEISFYCINEKMERRFMGGLDRLHFLLIIYGLSFVILDLSNHNFGYSVLFIVLR